MLFEAWSADRLPLGDPAAGVAGKPGAVGGGVAKVGTRLSREPILYRTPGGSGG